MRSPRDADEIKQEFARRLQAALVRKGWNQSEVARRANAHLPKPERGQKRNKAIGRDSLSHYLRGHQLPLPVYLDALAKALDLRPEDLMPTSGFAIPPNGAPLAVRGLPDGRMSLTVNRTVSSDTAMKIMAILAKEDEKA